MLASQQTKPGVIGAIIQSANPVFMAVAIGLPIAALVYALNFGTITALNFVHIMTGGLWMGIDLFLGFVLGPVLGGLEPAQKAAIFRRLIPRLTFLMPVLAGVTVTAGLELTSRMGFPMDNPRIVAALVITAILTIHGFGILLPNEIRIFRQLLSDRPDINKIASLGMFNAKLGGVQGLFQVAIIVIMALIRF